MDDESRFEALADEAVGPMLLEVDEFEWVLDVPSSDAVCELDDVTRPEEILAELLDDQADNVLDHLERRPWSLLLEVTARVRGHFALEVLPVGMWTRLVEQIDCYGEAIEADLFDRGADLLDWFRGDRPWPQLLRILARLPEGSRYTAALLGDDDLARQRLAETDDDPDEDPDRRRSRRPPLVGESYDRALRRATVSSLMRVEHAIYAVNAPKGKGGKPPRPLLGPETAQDRLREQLADAEVEDIFDQVAPGWRDVAPDPAQVGRDDPAAPAGFHTTASGLFVPHRLTDTARG